MPTIYPETIGGISIGFSSYLGLVCVLPYLQNTSVTNSYIIVKS